MRLSTSTNSAHFHDTLGSGVLAASRRGGHVYVTDGSGANPYAALPSYWSQEDSVASSGCTPG